MVQGGYPCGHQTVGQLRAGPFVRRRELRRPQGKRRGMMTECDGGRDIDIRPSLRAELHEVGIASVVPGTRFGEFLTRHDKWRCKDRWGAEVVFCRSGASLMSRPCDGLARNHASAVAVAPVISSRC